MPEKYLLLVEDDHRFAELLQEWLEDGLRPDGITPLYTGLRLQVASTLADALSLLDKDSPDLMLVDLNLPDSQGLITCDQLLAHGANIPLIVMSGLDDESLAIQAVRRGAQDYLVKNLLNGHLLIKAIIYALERNRLQKELEQTRQQQLQDREQEIFDSLIKRGYTQVVANAMGVHSLEKGQPEAFNHLTNRMVSIFEQVLEMRTYKISHPISKQLQELAEELGFLKCGPRDVVTLYKTARASLERPGNPLRNGVLHEEGRYLAFELMGYLVSFYRPYALGGKPPPSS
ncbi:MAG: response regulator [Magnetococcales bacterium]|nr:response regulator [Magnetococcales bacterium]